MRFFDHQANARSRSFRLTLAFAVTVALTVLGVHLALLVVWGGSMALITGHWSPPAGFVHANIGLALFLILGGWWLETSAIQQGSIKLAKRLGARGLHTANSFGEQRLDNIVSEIALSAQMRRPRVMLLPRVDEINAFALGLTPGDWLVVVTQGALTHLTRRELQGLIAHECSHLKEGDTRLNMQLLGMVGGLEMVHNYGAWVCEGVSDDSGGVPFLPVWLIGKTIMVAGFAGWLGGRLLQAAASREREFLADARAVQWTRDVDGLGGVLRKIMTQQATMSVSRANSLSLGTALWAPMAHLLLVEWEHNDTSWRDRLASHPSLDARVTRLYGDAKDRLPLVAVDERTGEVHAPVRAAV